MELAIPLLALGGFYVISNQSNEKNKNKNNNNNNNYETFVNMKQNQHLPNTNIPPENYPIINKKELIDNVNEYPNPNTATDKYFNQNLYEDKEINGKYIDNNIQDVYSLKGDYLDTNTFKHNNMVPFNGGKIRGQNVNLTNETLLDNYVGNGSQTIKKVEQAPLFKPEDNIQYAYGAPNNSDFYQSRVNPSLRNNMVKPFESEHVGPGLNQGYSKDGSGGFNSGMESRDHWLPKNVDELRVATNPKEEYSLENHQGPAQSHITNVGIIGKVEKYHPDTYYINSQDRWLTTTGAEKAGRLLATEIVKTSNRNETTKEITGTPNATLKTASYTPTNYEGSKKIQLEGYDITNPTAVGQGPITDGDTFFKSHTNYANNRSVNNTDDTFRGGVSGAIGAVIAPIMDLFKPSKKEEHLSNIRVYGNKGVGVPESYVYTDGDVPGVTIKETTLSSTHGNIGNQIAGAYETTNHQPVQNQRDTTNSSATNGAGGAGTKYGSRAYDAVYRQTNNDIKEQTIVGRTNHGNAKHFNPNINVSYSKADEDRENNRMWVPSVGIQSGPSAEIYGVTNNNQYDNKYTNDNNNVNNRINSDLLNAFKQNPYTHSLNSAV